MRALILTVSFLACGAAIARAPAGEASAKEASPPSLAERVHAGCHRATVLLHVIPGGGPAVPGQAGFGIYYGTGAVISADGLVLTSTTVVPPGAKTIRVMLHDGRAIEADAVCVDEPTELAVVRMKGKGPFDFLPWGNSDLAKVGDPCFTLGDFFSSMGNSAQVAVSEGIVSGRYKLSEQAKIVQQPVYLGEVIETSASMNPGTDGGPVVDAQGRLVGLVSLNLSPARFQGVAVPVNALRAKIEALLPGLPEADQASLRRALDAARTHARDASVSDIPISTAARERAAHLAKLRVKRKEAAAAPPKPAPPPPVPAGPGQPPPLQQEEREPIPGFREMTSRRPDVPATGVVWDGAGHLVTSFYNLRDAESVEVETADGTWAPCEILGWHKDFDIAFLKGPGAARGAFPRDRPQDLRIGEQVGVLALSPHEGGERHTLETGVVSSLRRVFNSAYQIDARVAFADSGSAVIDAQGNLAGVVTHFDPASPPGLASGVSFVTPLHKILEVERDLLEGKRIEAAPRPFLGFGPDPAWTGPGMRVNRVIPGSGAEKGGLAVGDVIVEFDRVRITNFPHLFDLIQSKKVGDSVTVLVRRDEKDLELGFVLGQRPQEEALR